MISGMGEKEEELGRGKGRRTGIDMQNEQKIIIIYLLKKRICDEQQILPTESFTPFPRDFIIGK